jgi:hypothetical protein
VKEFFFEKKNQKTFVSLRTLPERSATADPQRTREQKANK